MRTTEDSQNDNYNSDANKPEKKTIIIKWIGFFFLIALYSAIYFIIINLEQFPELDNLKTWIKFLIYIFLMVIFFGPFIPIKRRSGQRISILNSLTRMIEGPKKRRYRPKPQSNLNVEYKPPLISSCKKCGFLITRQMPTCPNCKTENQYYVPKD